MLFQMLRSLLVFTGTVFGFGFGYSIASEYPTIIEAENPELTFAVLLGFIGYLIFSISGRSLQLWIERQIDQTNISDLTWSAIGFVLGLICANLLLIPFYIMIFNAPDRLGETNKHLSALVSFFNMTLPLGFNLLFAYLGVKIMLRYKKSQDRVAYTGLCVKSKIMDTSAVLDGRFADLYRLGFLEGNVLIPNFVMNEVHLISLSDDGLRAGRGKKALELIQKLRNDFPDTVAVVDKDYPEVPELETRLLRLVGELKGVLVTQDANMNKIAEMEHITALNINDLANALKPVFISGEELEIKVVKKGKEPVQGVGFLSDGTMVVVEDGGEHVDKVVKAKVTNILQTGAGRMIFCRINN